MRYLLDALISATLVVSSSTVSPSSVTPIATVSSLQIVVTEPCAIISSSAKAFRSLSPKATPTVAAQLAYECLNSVPLGRTAAIRLVDSIVPYVEWQSDLAFKKDPPADYHYPPHDILGSLALVKTNLQNGVYQNEYEFQKDLYTVFIRGRDGHFLFIPDALGVPFTFRRARPLVSVSRDGVELPQIKLLEDVLSSPDDAPAIVKINGMEADKFVAEASDSTGCQDRDASYNAMFYSQALDKTAGIRGLFESGGRTNINYPGPNTTFVFDNGTSVTFENVALLRKLFVDVNDGKTFYSAFCTGNTYRSPSTFVSGGLQPGIILKTPEFPVALVQDSARSFSGFYLDGTRYKDIAVLSATEFVGYSLLELQQAAQKFIATAVRDGKGKIIIDLSANGGGWIANGYDLFKQFFPGLDQDGYTQFRVSDTFSAMAKIVSDIPPSNDTHPVMPWAFQTFLNYKSDLNRTNQRFDSFEAKFGPQKLRGDNFTHIVRFDLTNSVLTGGINITGYGDRKDFAQPFHAENIIMLTDGFCASTCAVFAGAMKSAGVKVIAIGGRPQAGQIQAIGGIKGAQVFPWNYILEDLSTRAQRWGRPNEEQRQKLSQLTRLPIARSAALPAVNGRNQILRGKENLPAQFVHEPADCRLFYTAAMINDVTELWKAVADVAFNGNGACVAGKLPTVQVEYDITGRNVDAGIQGFLERSMAPIQRGPQIDITKVSNVELGLPAIL